MYNNISVTKQAMIFAYEKGYRVVQGKIINPKGKQIKESIYTYPTGCRYKRRMFNVCFKNKSIAIVVAHLVAYQKYKKALLEKGI